MARPLFGNRRGPSRNQFFKHDFLFPCSRAGEEKSCFRLLFRHDRGLISLNLPLEMVKKTLKASLALSLLFCMAGCHSSTFPVGENVVIEIDRSTLGASPYASLPVDGTQGSAQGKVTSFSGKLIAVDHHWIQLRVETFQNERTLVQDYWIPTEKILYIRKSGFQKTGN